MARHTEINERRNGSRRRQVGVVYRKELIDILRDRRALVSMVVVPLLVIPVLVVGLGALSFFVMEQARQEVHRVMVLGGGDSPGIVEQLRELESIEAVPEEADYVERILRREVRAAVEIPDGFEVAIEEERAPPPVTIYVFEGEVKSSFAAGVVREFFRGLRDREVEDRLRVRGLTPDLLEVFDLRTANVAPPEKVTGSTLGGVIPYIIILLCLTGAMYPAMDLTAGEKERGTMETIMSSPVSRVSLVLGKYLVVLTASLATALLSIGSLGALLVFGFRSLDRFAGGEPLMALDPAALVAVFFILLPVACLFSAALLALSLFARSFKEAQSYVSPLFLVAVLPAVAATLPGMEIGPGLIWAPVLNIALVSREMMIGNYDWGAIGLVFGTTCVYAILALGLAVNLFHRESVLFRS